MAELTATAVAMINSSVELVHSALVDYESVRPLLLPDNFDDYRVLAGGQGAGTEVSWTLLVGETRRRRWQLGRPKREPWDCLVQVDEPADDQIVERDTRTELVTTWTVHEAGDGRTAVRVLASWPAWRENSPANRSAAKRLLHRSINASLQSSLSRISAQVWPASSSSTKRARRASSARPARLATRWSSSMRSAFDSVIVFMDTIILPF